MYNLREHVPTAAMDLYCSVLLFRKSWRGHGGNSHSERNSKAALFLTIIVSITFVRTEGGVKCAAQNHKEKIIKYLNYPKFGKGFSHAKCSVVIWYGGIKPVPYKLCQVSSTSILKPEKTFTLFFIHT